MVRVGALRQTQREDTQPSKNDPASGSLFAVAQRFAAFCSNVTSLFSTATHDGSKYARVYLHGLMQARHRAKNMDRMEEAVNTTAALARWTMDRCGNAQHAAHLARRSWPAHGISLSAASMMPKARWVWTTIRPAAGSRGINT